jgi:hypothetical protein
MPDAIERLTYVAKKRLVLPFHCPMPFRTSLIYVTIESPNIAASILNNDLQKINNWSDRWLVKFNPQKTETMLISRKTSNPYMLNFVG